MPNASSTPSPPPLRKSMLSERQALKEEVQATTSSTPGTSSTSTSAMRHRTPIDAKQQQQHQHSATDIAAAESSQAASSSASSLSPRRKKLTRAQLAARIAAGETLVLHGTRIYKLDSWLARHPGGAVAILHFVGRDASDEIEAYHSAGTLERMRHFAIAELDLEEEKLYKPLVPPIQLGYRKGTGLESPHAHLDTWQSYLAQLPPAQQQQQKERPTNFPLPVGLLEPPSELPKGIDPQREAEISSAYKRMHQQVKNAGLYTLRPAGYARECARYLLLGLLSYTCFHAAKRTEASDLPPLISPTYLYLLSSVFLGFLWHQATFTAHDAGHSGITHSHAADRVIGTLIADFLGGLSIGWWCDNHDVHHLVTNHPEHDPDIQHMPFFAISPRFLIWQTDGNDDDTASSSGGKKNAVVTPGLWSSYYRRVLAFDAPSRLFLRFQHQLYYIVMSLGRFNLYANSYGFLALKARRDRWFAMELTGLAFFAYWYGYRVLASLPTWRLRIAYLLISHILTSPLHVQIVLSHFAQSSDDLGLYESFASRQIRTTMDVQCPTYLDFLHGGLHMQVSHHLFPRLPRHNLREARERFVRPFADKWGLPYEEYTFTSGNRKVLGVLQSVASQVDLLSKVAKAQARGELH